MQFEVLRSPLSQLITFKTDVAYNIPFSRLKCLLYFKNANKYAFIAINSYSPTKTFCFQSMVDINILPKDNTTFSGLIQNVTLTTQNTNLVGLFLFQSQWL